MDDLTRPAVHRRRDYGTDLSEAELQILGAMPFDPRRASAFVMATIAGLKEKGYVDTEPETGANRLTPKGVMTKALVRYPTPPANG